MNKKDFSILAQKGVYLDHAASSLTPDCVLDAIQDYYHHYRANVHRGVYAWSERSSVAYETSRATVARFIGALPGELAFTSGATAAINQVAQGYLQHYLQPGDVILVTPLEHHANLIPWQQVAKNCQASVKCIPLCKNHTIDWDALALLIEQEKVVFIAMTHSSNVLGIKNDIRRMVAFGIPVLVDGAQAVSHEPVDVHALGCAFYAFSAHKMYGPTGIGALYIKNEFLEKMQPCFTGGGMVLSVDYETASFQKGVVMLEAGTPNIAGAIGFAKACEYIKSIGFMKIMAHEKALMAEINQTMVKYPLRTFGPSQTTVLSFQYPNVHAHDVATVLADENVMVRAGHHCCMPLMQYLGVNALTRLSIGLYNDIADVHLLDIAFAKISEVMQV